jgi:multisubunit Na+/H+ antiporter MnhE subunit
MNRIIASIVLLFRFLRAVVVSGIQTVRIILSRGLRIGDPAPAAFVRLRFAPMNATGASLLGCMITLTPGTTVIDIDMEEREMVVHMLDRREAQSLIRSVQREFEPGLLVWFGERP